MRVLEKLIGTEEARIDAVIAVVFTVIILASELDWYWKILAIGGLALLIFVTEVLGLKSKMKKMYTEPKDERSARCAQLAGRNAFVFALLALAAYAAISRVYAVSTWSALLLVVSLMVGTYSISYSLYLTRGMGVFEEREQV